MKKLLVTLLLVTAAFAMAQDRRAAAGQQPTPQKKVIQDPAEYNAYVAAVQTQDIAARETALEAFLQSYPKSVMKDDTLETLVKLYQQTGPIPKFLDAANRLLQTDPNNITGLALLSYVDRALFVSNPNGPNAQNQIAEAGELANRGLQLLPNAAKPLGYADADWAKMKDAFKSIFIASAGHAAFVAKNYPKAQQELRAAVDSNPTDVNLVYLLARSYLDPKPPVVDGLFWIARAAALAPAGPTKDDVVKYARSKYRNYHGDVDGFDQLLTDASTRNAITPGFTVTPAPSPAEQAALMLQKSAPEKLSFGEWEFIMTSGNQQAIDQVWNTIKGKSVKMQGWLIDGAGKELKIAGTPEANDTKQADIQLTLNTPVSAKSLPKPGTLITFQGVADSFVASPFVMKMTDGSVALAEAPKSTATKKK